MKKEKKLTGTEACIMTGQVDWRLLRTQKQILLDNRRIMSNKILEVIQIKTSACETLFEVNGVELRLWIITGGTPALSFSDYNFTERYPSIKLWDNSHYNKGQRAGSGYYDHQNPDSPQGPTYEVLPNGLKSVQAFLDKYLSKHVARAELFNQLPRQGILRSKRLHDKENHCYFYCEVNIRLSGMPSVTEVSNYYCGTSEEWDHLIPESWQKLTKTLKLFSASSAYRTNWEDLTTEQYEEICQAIKNVLV